MRNNKKPIADKERHYNQTKSRRGPKTHSNTHFSFCVFSSDFFMIRILTAHETNLSANRQKGWEEYQVTGKEENQTIFTFREGGRRNKLIKSSKPCHHFNQISVKFAFIVNTAVLDKPVYYIITRVVMTRKLKSTIKYDPNTRSKSKSNVTLATYKYKHQIVVQIKKTSEKMRLSNASDHMVFHLNCEFLTLLWPV